MWTKRLSTVSASVALLLIAVLGLGACSSDSPSSPTEDAAVNVVQSQETPQSEEEPDGPSQAELQAYFEALASEDPGVMAEAVDMAAPGSNAQAYAIYLSAVAQADRDGGYSTDPSSVKPIEGGFEICSAGISDQDSCNEYTNVQHEGDQIADFDTGGKPLSGRLSLGSGEAEPLGDVGSATMVAAYESISGAVVVVFEVSSTDEGMWVTATYVAPSGRQAEPTMMGGPINLGDGAFANNVFAFEGAEFGGQIKLTAINGDGFESGTAAFATQ